MTTNYLLKLLKIFNRQFLQQRELMLTTQAWRQIFCGVSFKKIILTFQNSLQKFRHRGNISAKMNGRENYEQRIFAPALRVYRFNFAANRGVFSAPKKIIAGRVYKSADKIQRHHSLHAFNAFKFLGIAADT